MNQLSDELLVRASSLSSATMHEASGKKGALPASIKPLAPMLRVCGRAQPVLSPPGDNLWLHRAIYEANPSDVLIVDVGDGVEHGYWGEVMALAAQERGIAGLIITGGVRDSLRMIEMGFPVFAPLTCVKGTGKNPKRPGSVGQAIDIGGVTVRRGDLVFGDADGVVIFDADTAESVVAESERRDHEEQDIFERLRNGATTIDIYNLPGAQA